MAGTLRHRLPTRNTVRLLLAPALAFIVTSLDRGYQTDYWQHLARGRLIATERAVVGVDRFTFTAAGQPVYDNNWLSQLLYYAVHSAGGLAGVQAVNSLALGSVLLVLVSVCHRKSGSTAIAAAAGVGAFLGLWPTFLIRPQTFSMVLFVLLYALLDAAQRRPRLLVVVPAFMALWANVHGGFAVGLALILSSALAAGWERLSARLPIVLRSRVRDATQPPPDEWSRAAPPDPTSALALLPNDTTAPPYLPPPQLSRLVACLVVSAAATLANPYGWGVYRYAGRLSAVGVARGIEEWLPPSLGSLNGSVWAASLALLACLLVVSARRPTAREACLLVCFGVPSFVSVRMTVWWFLAAAPVMARLAAGVGARRTSGRATQAHDLGNGPTCSAADRPSAVAAFALAVLACVAVLSLPWLERFNPVMGNVRTTRRTESDLQAAADRLTPRDRPVRVFTRMEWANYLTWSASDRAAVFVEGHVELYGDATWRRYLAITEGRPGWEALLDADRVDVLLLDQGYHRTLLEQVSRSPNWARRASSGPAVLFERRDPPPAAPAVAGADF